MRKDKCALPEADEYELKLPVALMDTVPEDEAEKLSPVIRIPEV